MVISYDFSKSEEGEMERRREILLSPKTEWVYCGTKFHTYSNHDCSTVDTSLGVFAHFG
jgi:5-methylcytosine-specific restriction endonuclease McrA